eukprot:gene9774-7656_t
MGQLQTQPGLGGPMNPDMRQQQPGVSPALGQPMLPPVKKPKRRVLTSLTLQIFIYFGALWDVFYFVLNLLVFFYKGTSCDSYNAQVCDSFPIPTSPLTSAAKGQHVDAIFKELFGARGKGLIFEGFDGRTFLA